MAKEADDKNQARPVKPKGRKAPKSVCSTCKKPIPLGAIKCTHDGCGAYQGWRKFFFSGWGIASSIAGGILLLLALYTAIKAFYHDWAPPTPARVAVQLTRCNQDEIAMLTTNTGGTPAPVSRPTFHRAFDGRAFPLDWEEFVDADPFEADDEVVNPGDQDVQRYRVDHGTYFREDQTGGARCRIMVRVPLSEGSGSNAGVEDDCSCVYRH